MGHGSHYPSTSHTNFNQTVNRMEERVRLPDTRAYWQRFAEAFAAPLRANGQLSAFIANPAVTGAYAEAWFRSLLLPLLPNLRISTGAIIRTSDELTQKDLKTLPQSDIIIWDPAELPALFATADFALIHAQAARGIIEVKRTADSPKAMQPQLEKQRKRLLTEHRRNVLGVVLSAPRPLHDVTIEPEWVSRLSATGPVPVVRLLDADSAAADADGIFALIYFLRHVSRHSPH